MSPAATTQIDLPVLQEAVGILRRAVHRLEPKHLSGSEAAELIRSFAEVERLGAAGKTLAARAVEKTRAWQAAGHQSAAHWLASETGVAVGQAVGTMETARRLEHLPRTAEAFASGELSEAKVKEVAVAASACPSAEGELLEAARTDTVLALRTRCRNVVASATDELERYGRIRANRHLRHWMDVQGAFRLALSTTPDAGADLLAAIEPHQRRIATEARKAGRKESQEAYAADALVALAKDRSGSASGPRFTSVIRIDHPALVRGHTEGWETCEIAGIGPIPVATARALMADSFLKLVVARGTDVTTVAHAGRTIPATVRTAVDARYPTCAIIGCDTRKDLEYHHLIDFALGGPTSKDNLVRLCHHHHDLRTHHGYRLVGEHPNWTLVGPDPPV